MRTHRIDVMVESNAIRVEPGTLVMTTQDEVHWAGGGRFSIEFDGDGPFGSRQLAYEAATTRRKPAAKGRFKYTVISERDPAVRLDPVIIIDPPPSGGTE